MIEEFFHLRRPTISLFRSMRNDMLLRKGNASGYEVTVRGLVYIIVGHMEYYLKVIKERYLNAASNISIPYNR